MQTPFRSRSARGSRRGGLLPDPRASQFRNLGFVPERCRPAAVVGARRKVNRVGRGRGRRAPTRRPRRRGRRGRPRPPSLVDRRAVARAPGRAEALESAPRLAARSRGWKDPRACARRPLPGASDKASGGLQRSRWTRRRAAIPAEEKGAWTSWWLNGRMSSVGFSARSTARG